MKYLVGKLTVVSLLLLQGCGSNEPKTLASLSYEPEQESVEKPTEIDIKPITHQELRQEYKAVLGLFEEKALKEKIERRIADVHMMEGTHNQNTDVPKSSYYSEATQAYRDILKKYPNSPDNAEVLYQLSKAYDIEGKQEEALDALSQLTSRYPDYVNIDEAYFREGDIHFSNQRYTKAETSYISVIEANNDKLSLNAHYMLGWSRYKLLEYRQSVDSFSYVLNQLLTNNVNIDDLGKKEKPLVNDSISSISLAIDKIGGAKTIGDIKSLARQNYVWRIYDNLGEYYLAKELYEESASTFRLYVDGYQLSDKAPDLSTKLINTYLAGGFAAQGLKEKENYVNSYGINSRYYSSKNGATTTVKASLKTYLDELASHFHSKGQFYQKEIAEAKKKDSTATEKEKIPGLYENSIASLDKAADFYSEYVQTFPGDERIDEVTFLKAEALFSSYQYPRAIKEYEKVAYQPQGVSAEEHAENAGYAAIISYEKQIDVLKTGKAYKEQLPQKIYSEDSREIKKWKQNAVGSMLTFAETFHTDERSPSVLTNAAEYLFSLNQYRNAIDVSTGLIAKNATLDKTLKKTAYGIIAHSHFKLEEFQQAEDNYLNQRLLVEQGTDEYNQISERLAASIYKKSEVMIAGDEKIAAIDQLLKIKQLTPQSSIRVTAQYDAATLLLEVERWGDAIAELLELQELFPEYEYAVEFPRKLAFAYEKNEDWSNAASAYVFLVSKDPDETIRQEALFLAATMYERDENYIPANQRYESYIQQYPMPFDNYMEAHYRLAVNEETLKNVSGRNEWLTKIIDVDKVAGSQRTDRSRWLGAWANAKYGDYYASAFSQTRLKLPLVKSIPDKNKWLERASTSYQLSADYGILEFVAMSSYKIGALYRQFAGELRGAPAPAGLSESDQQIYASIIEEQAAPFDQLAIDLHQANIDRAWDGKFNEWINKSFTEMRVLHPKRYNKVELIVSYGDGIY